MILKRIAAAELLRTTGSLRGVSLASRDHIGATTSSGGAVAADMLTAAVGAVAETGGDVLVGIEANELRLVTSIKRDVPIAVRPGDVRFEKSHRVFTVTDATMMQRLESSVGVPVQFAVDPADDRIVAVLDDVPPDAAAPDPSRPQLYDDYDTALYMAATGPQQPPRLVTDRLIPVHRAIQMQPHIPFIYPADGCWTRAHEACRLMVNYFRVPQDHMLKVWLFAASDAMLTVKTDLDPQCRVRWGWHVAPLVHSEDGPRVIDPALFGGPVTIDEWRAATGPGGLRGNLRYSTSERYHYVDSRDDATAVAPELAEHRNDLAFQIARSGPLPYLCPS